MTEQPLFIEYRIDQCDYGMMQPIKNYFRDNFNPEDIFAPEQLNAWALKYFEEGEWQENQDLQNEVMQLKHEIEELEFDTQSTECIFDFFYKNPSLANQQIRDFIYNVYGRII